MDYENQNITKFFDSLQGARSGYRGLQCTFQMSTTKEML